MTKIRLAGILIALGAMIAAPQTGAADKDAAREAFAGLDSNGDGVISREEFEVNKVNVIFRRSAARGASLKFEDTLVSRATFEAVDVDGDYQYMRVMNYAKANGRMAQFDSMQAKVARRVKQQSDFLQSHTVLETLERMNSDSATTEALAAEMEYVSFGDLWEFAGPDLLTFWFQRNLRIYNRISALIESPAERILVIYGNGHLGPFRQIIGADVRVRLRKLSDVMGKVE